MMPRTMPPPRPPVVRLKFSGGYPTVPPGTPLYALTDGAQTPVGNWMLNGSHEGAARLVRYYTPVSQIALSAVRGPTARWVRFSLTNSTITPWYISFNWSTGDLAVGDLVSYWIGTVQTSLMTGGGRESNKSIPVGATISFWVEVQPGTGSLSLVVSP